MIDMRNFVVDVLIEILLRLPAKQLCQLKTVAKQWLLIISSPHFKRLYNERSMRNPQLLIVQESDEGHTHSQHGLLSRTLHMSIMNISTGVIRREFSTDVWGRHYSFLSICNLFCYNNYGSYSVCNPTTHERVDLPLATFPRSGFYLGYLPDDNEYKIVHVFEASKTYDPDAKVRFQILTLKDGGPIPSSWRIIEDYTPRWSYNAASVNIKSSIYWLIYNRKRREKKIISIELKSERFATICCPEASPAPAYKNGDREQLTEMKGHLCLAHFSVEYSTMSTYVLKDHENHIWVKECSIDLSNRGKWFKIIGYLPCDNNNGEIILRCDYENLLSYNVKDRRFRRLGRIESPLACYVSFYFDRLFSLGEKEKEDVEEEKEDESSEEKEDGSSDDEVRLAPHQRS